ncbi:UNVERIFIED_CONTAM: hypothetical protein K2H54_022482 [Gekko kuhli]
MAATILLYFATTGATGGVTVLSALKSTVIRPVTPSALSTGHNGALQIDCMGRMTSHFKSPSIVFAMPFSASRGEFLDPRVRINGWHGQRGFQSRTVMYRIDKVRAPRKLPEEAIGQINGDTVAAEKASSENPIVLSLIVTGSYRGRKVSYC